jgi:formate C-acetyltransferase
MSDEAKTAIDHGIFTPGNHFYNGIGHLTVDYPKVLAIGYSGIIKEAKEALSTLSAGDFDYAKRSHFLNAVIMSCEAAIAYAKRYADLAANMARGASDIK